MCQKMDRRGFFVDVLCIARHLTGLCVLHTTGLVASLFSLEVAAARDTSKWSATLQANDVLGAGELTGNAQAQELVARLQRMGIDFSLFETLWWAAFMHDKVAARESLVSHEQRHRIQEKLWPQALEFLRGFCELVFRSSTQMQDELALVSKLLSSFWGRCLVMGKGDALTALEPEEIRASLDIMAQSSLSFRRKIHQGVVIFMGMSQMSRPVFALQTGFPGTPLHVLEIWNSKSLSSEAQAEKENP